MRTFFKLTFISLAIALIAGCADVPIGHVGMIQKPNGLTGQVLSPGNYACLGRDKMILVDISENVASEPMEILCDDDLNFKFDLKIRSQLNTTDGGGIKELLNRKGSSAKNNVLKFDVLYKTYVKPEARAIARGIVSKYKTTEIRSNREKIDAEIKDKLLEALKGTPMKVTMVASSNYDYPDVITTAMEKKRQREIEIDEQKAKQAVELLKMENRQKIAQKARIVRAAEAEAEAVYNKILGNSLKCLSTPS